MDKRRVESLHAELEGLYREYHHPDWIGSDPIRFVHEFTDDRDREIVGLIAALLAYGNVKYIQTSIGRVLDRLERRPHEVITSSSERALVAAAKGFRHRWTDGDALADLLLGMRRCISDHGSLGAAFLAADREDTDITLTLGRWTELLKGERGSRMIPDPTRGSACKRLHLYLRWMIRRDGIDPGCWEGVSPRRLKVPLDTHIFAYARSRGLTRRNAPDGRTVDEVTASLRAVCPDDPVKYDFALTRPGIALGVRP